MINQGIGAGAQAGFVGRGRGNKVVLVRDRGWCVKRDLLVKQKLPTCSDSNRGRDSDRDRGSNMGRDSDRDRDTAGLQSAGRNSHVGREPDVWLSGLGPRAGHA